MKAVGVVVEYNPFHNGHAYHAAKSRELARADVVIAVMSGPFLQRGEPALVPKQIRAKMALQAGVDIVIELPYAFAVQKADLFAKGAVALLAAIGCESICFGSENGDIKSFVQTASFLEDKQDMIEQYVKKHIRSGASYPKAFSLAFLDIAKGDNQELLDWSKPNNSLGLHYVRAIHSLKANLVPLTIGRKQADYHDPELPGGTNTIASATSIRTALLKSGDFSELASFVPKTTITELKEYLNMNKSFHSWENYWPLLQYRLLSSSPTELATLYDVHEGIENRLIQAAKRSQSFHDFLSNVKTKRYTWTRLQRMCVHILMSTLQTDLDRLVENTPHYLRLLGMTEKGQFYLKKHKSSFTLPLVSKLSSCTESGIADDIKASNLYALGLTGQAQLELLKKDFTEPPIMI